MSNNFGHGGLRLSIGFMVYHGYQKGVSMAYRAPVKKKKDKKIFHETANTTKKINVAPKAMRGGIRL